jgi:hypothetical protein
VGGDVMVRPDEAGRHLVAAIGLDLLALMPIDSIGSGGRIPNQSKVELVLAA